MHGELALLWFVVSALVQWAVPLLADTCAVYLAQPDGLLHDYDDVNGIVDRLMTSVVDAKTLVTTSWSQGTEIAHASRVLSDDGLAMTISQSGFGADGESFCNLSVYRKVQ